MIQKRLASGVAAAMIAGLAASCSSPPAKTPLVITFDVEDYITPESEHVDDIPKWLEEIMTEEGVTGTFFVIGEKARSLESRGRRDVIAAMARHDIGSHTHRGSIHPTVTEQLEHAGWNDGVNLMLEQESAGLKDLERIFGVPVMTLARHGGSYGPQLVAALGRMKAGYQGSPASLPGHDVVWFANALNFSAQYGGFDDAYSRDDLFGPIFDKLKAELPGALRNAEVLALFAGHPTKIRAEEFWDLNFYGGRNTGPGEWKAPRLRPPESMKTARKNFRRMMRYLRSRDDIEITTYRELMAAYGRQKESMTTEELGEMAAAALRTQTLTPSEFFSPAEAFAALAESIAEYGRAGLLRGTVRVQHPLGPLKRPPVRPEIPRLTFEEICDLAREAEGFIRKSGALPESLNVGPSPVGTGSLFALFSAVYRDIRSGRPRPNYEVIPFEPYPATNEKEIIDRIDGYKSWPVHRPDLDMSGIIELTKLQLWTLKPARREAAVGRTR